TLFPYTTLFRSGDVRVDAALSGDGDVAALAIEARLRREQYQVREVAPGDRELLELLGLDRGGGGGVGHLDDRSAAGDGDRLGDGGKREREVDGRRLAQLDDEVARDGVEAGKPRADPILAGRQVDQTVRAAAVGDRRCRESGLGVFRVDADSGKRRFVGVLNDSRQAAGGDVG